MLIVELDKVAGSSPPFSSGCVFFKYTDILRCAAALRRICRTIGFTVARLTCSPVLSLIESCRAVVQGVHIMESFLFIYLKINLAV